ncbi:EthD domain-containing protein [Halenospora varia]|nr:EthD domain-containing protein [Halenospora varia]
MASIPQSQKVLKLTIFQQRNPSLTEEEFHKHWTEKYAALASAWFAKNGILGYTQYHTPSSARALLGPLANKVGLSISPYDGHVEILLRSVEDLENALKDPLYAEVVGPDEGFMDQSRSMVTVGWEEVYIRDGKIVNVD